jgi:hypothetical protein
MSKKALPVITTKYLKSLCSKALNSIIIVFLIVYCQEASLGRGKIYAVLMDLIQQSDRKPGLP